MKRSGKFYYRNEREIMERLGLKQVPGSGNGWVCKEDGENEHVLCQLKSTDKRSIRIDLLDVEKLLYHAYTSHKIPVFAVEYLDTGDLFLMLRPEDLEAAAQYLKTGCVEKKEEFVPDVQQFRKKKQISSSVSARDSWHKSREESRKGKEVWKT